MVWGFLLNIVDCFVGKWSGRIGVVVLTHSVPRKASGRSFKSVTEYQERPEAVRTYPVIETGFQVQFRLQCACAAFRSEGE